MSKMPADTAPEGYYELRAIPEDGLLTDQLQNRQRLGIIGADRTLMDTHFITTLLDDDPFCRLNLEVGLERFIGLNERPEHNNLDFMQEAYSQLGLSANKAQELHCVVAIPVAAHQEYGNIFHTLEQYSRQEMPDDRFEIVLFLNMPGGDASARHANSLAMGRTIAEIERFQTEYPQLAVRYFSMMYESPSPAIGTIRADLWSAIAFDMQQRGRQDDILVVSGDADVEQLSPDFLSSMHATWQSTGSDIISGSLSWQSIPGLPADSTANRMLGYYAALDELRDRHSPILRASEAATAVSLAMYLAVGGFKRSLQAAEMIDLTDAIRYNRLPVAMRRQWRTFEDRYRLIGPYPVEALAANARLTTNARRATLAMALGQAPYKAWNQDLITFGSDDAIRTIGQPAEAAEANARRLWRRWVRQMTAGCAAWIPPEIQRQTIPGIRRQYGFDDMYAKH